VVIALFHGAIDCRSDFVREFRKGGAVYIETAAKWVAYRMIRGVV
jgi:hypothetical protein